MANLYFTYSLHDKKEHPGIFVNALHPGFVDTGFGDNNTGWFGSVFGMVKGLFARNDLKGALTSIYLASDADIKGVSGKYFIDKKIKKTNAVSMRDTDRERLWQMSLEMCGIEKFF